MPGFFVSEPDMASGGHIIQTMNKLAAFLFLAVLTLPVLTSCAVNPATGNPEMVMMSEEDELSLGRELNKRILAQVPVYEDKALQRYVQAVGERVAEASHRSGLYYRFTVLDRPEINAFALPGGYIYIFRGLLAYLNSEAELAAVLGHEVAHVTARHAVRQHRNQLLAQILATAVAIEAGGQVADMSQILGAAILKGYGRGLELEADRFGAEYLAASGYDHEAMLRVISVLKHQEEYEKEKAEKEDREPNVYHGVFSSHPENDDRLQTVVRAAAKLRKGPEPRIGQQEYYERIEGMTFGFGRKDGIQRGSNFYHEELDFAFSLPEGWRLDNQPSRLLLYAPGGKARAQITAHDLNKRIDEKTFAEDRLRIKGLKETRTREVNGLKVFIGRFPESALLSRRHIHLAITYIDDQAIVFQAVNKEDDDDYGLSEPFDLLVGSLHRMTDEEREIARPLVLATSIADANTRYASLAKESPVEQDALSTLRLLNQDYPDGEPEPGERLKIVR